MGRIIITVIVLAAIAAGIFYYQAEQNRHEIESRDQQIEQLRSQVTSIQKENEELKINLQKVQGEQTNLAAQNEVLNKAIAEYKSTGKMPEIKLPLPYPPK